MSATPGRNQSPSNRAQTPDEVNFWMRWGHLQHEITDGIARLEQFGVDDVRFIEWDPPPGSSAPVVFQVTFIVRSDKTMISSQIRGDGSDPKTPVEALHGVMRFWHRVLTQGQHKMPKTPDVIFDSQGRPITDERPPEHNPDMTAGEVQE